VERRGGPTRESLHELDLDYVADDFEKRGILPPREPAATRPAALAGRAT